MLQRRIGRLFASLAALSFVFNAFVDHSPQAGFNALEMLIVGPVFLLTSFVTGRFFQGVQIVTMIICALISFRLSENPYFGFAIVTLAGAILYAYGGYRTFQGVKIGLSVAFVYTLSFVSILGFIPFSLETAFKAFNWTAAIVVASLVWWWIMVEIERIFHLQMKTEIDRNRVEIESIKKDMGGCPDADNP